MLSHLYAAVLSVGTEVESVTSCPAIANARTGFRLSTIELGIRIDRAPFIVTGDVQRKKAGVSAGFPFRLAGAAPRSV